MCLSACVLSVLSVWMSGCLAVWLSGCLAVCLCSVCEKRPRLSVCLCVGASCDLFAKNRPVFLSVCVLENLSVWPIFHVCPHAARGSALCSTVCESGLQCWQPQTVSQINTNEDCAPPPKVSVCSQLHHRTYSRCVHLASRSVMGPRVRGPLSGHELLSAWRAVRGSAPQRELSCAVTRRPLLHHRTARVCAGYSTSNNDSQHFGSNGRRGAPTGATLELV